MPSFLKKRLSILNSKTNRRISNAVGAVMQPLEGRTLLSGGTVTVINGPTLYVPGPPGSAGQVTVNASPATIYIPGPSGGSPAGVTPLNSWESPPNSQSPADESSGAGQVTVNNLGFVSIQGASGGDGFKAVGAGEMSSNPNSTLPPTSLIIGSGETGGSSQVTVNNLGVVSIQGAPGGDGFEAVGAGEMSSNSQSPADETGGGQVTVVTAPAGYVSGPPGGWSPGGTLVMGTESSSISQSPSDVAVGGQVTIVTTSGGGVSGPPSGSSPGGTLIPGTETSSSSQSPADGTGGGTLTGHALPPVYIQGSSGAGGTVTDNILPPGYIPGPVGGSPAGVTPINGFETTSNSQSPADGADGAGQVTDNILPPGYIQGPPNGISEEFTPVPTIGTASNLQSPADVTPASSTLPGSGESIADSLSSQAGGTDTGYYDDGPSVYDSISGTIGLL